MPKTIIGTVSSNANDKTIVVKVERRKTHPLYRKQYKDTTRFMAHDENNEAKVGDKVEITECRPLSAKKHFKLTKILETPALREEELAAIKADEPKKKKDEENAS